MAIATAAIIASVAGAALSTGLGVATGALIGASAAMAYFAGSTAIGLALAALSKEPNFDLSSNSTGYKVTTTGTNLPRQIVYGETKVGGVVIFDEVTNGSRFLHRVMALADHEIDSVTKVFFNDDEVTIGAGDIVTNPGRYTNDDGNRSRVQFKLGTTGQTAFSDLVSESSLWTSNHRARGVALIYTRLKYANAFQGGVPDITVIIKGKKVYDPRTTNTVWSDNPSLCIRDYIVNYLGDEVDESSFSTAANDCDDVISSEKRFTLNGSFTTDNTPQNILSMMLTSCGGSLWYSQGKWRLKVGKWKSSILSLGENDLTSGLNIQTKPPLNDLYSTVKGQFKGPETDYEVTEYPFVSDAAYIAADGQDTTFELDLPFTNTSVEAQRTANLFLRRNREQIVFSASFNAKALQCQVGDTITFTYGRMGWTSKTFEVISWNFSFTAEELSINLTLKETSAAVYNDPTFTDFSRNNTNLPSWAENLVVQNLTASDGGYTNSDGSFTPTIIIDWDAPVNDGMVKNYEVQYKLSTDSKWVSRFETDTKSQVNAVKDGALHNIRVRVINNVGLESDWVTINYTPGADTTAPANPTGFTAQGDYKLIKLDWTNPTDADFNYCEVWENGTSSTVGRTKIASAFGDTFTRNNLGFDVTKYYWIRAVDYTGNIGSFVGPVSGTTTFVDDPDFEGDIVDYFESNDLYVIRQIASTAVSGAFEGEKAFSLADSKLYSWNDTLNVWEDIFTATLTGDLVGEFNASEVENLFAAKTILAEKIVATSLNYCENPGFELGSVAWDLPTNTSVSLSDGVTDSRSLRFAETGGVTRSVVNSNIFEVEAGESYTISGYAKQLSATYTSLGIRIQFLEGDLTPISSLGAVSTTLTGTIAKISNKVTAPSNAVFGRVVVQAVGQTAGSLHVDNIFAGKANGADLIVDGTITGGLLASAGIITGTAQIGDALITNAKLGNLSVDTAKIDDLAVDRIKVANNSIVVMRSLVNGSSVSFNRTGGDSSSTGGTFDLFTHSITSGDYGDHYMTIVGYIPITTFDYYSAAATTNFVQFGIDFDNGSGTFQRFGYSPVFTTDHAAGFNFCFGDVVSGNSTVRLRVLKIADQGIDIITLGAWDFTVFEETGK